MDKSTEKDRAYVLTMYDDEGKLCTPVLHQFKMQTDAQRKKHRLFQDKIADMKGEDTKFLLSLVLTTGGDVGIAEEDDPRTVREDCEDELLYMKDGIDGIHNTITNLVCECESWTSDIQMLENDVLSLT